LGEIYIHVDNKVVQPEATPKTLPAIELKDGQTHSRKAHAEAASSPITRAKSGVPSGVISQHKCAKRRFQLRPELLPETFK
jgi:hypothetical protein